MKALSFHQPWAELILQGRKTLDLRTYRRDYRGPLAVHAALEIERAACLLYGLDPSTLPTGSVVGIVELVDIVPLDAAEYAARSAEHLGGRHFHEPMYGWVLRNPRRLAGAIPLRGQRNLFTIDIELDPTLPTSRAQGATTTITPGHIPPSSARQADTTTRLGAGAEGTSQALPFELRVVPDQPTAASMDYALALRQRVVEPADDHLYTRGSERLTTIATLRGDVLRVIADHVIEAMRQSGYKPTDLGPHRSTPFFLSEAVGVRLGLILLAVKPLSKVGRIEAVAQGIRLMSTEEAYYWYSKCTARDTAERAQTALRVLLAAA